MVQQGLQTILADRTAVIIAHRLSTVEIADRVLVLEHGQVVEEGSPAELAERRGGRYAALHQAWADSLADRPEPDTSAPRSGSRARSFLTRYAVQPAYRAGSGLEQ